MVDSSVWIAYLNPRTSEVDSIVESLIRPVNQAVITGIVFQEVLQGIRNEKSYHLVASLIGRLPLLEPEKKTYLKATQIFRETVSKGKSCTTVDALIAALAIQYGIRLLTLDRDFQTIAKHSDLKLFSF
ncbi:MAG: PIN domain nuclease [Candidatus Omnitrophica bacterium]|nr:PIN domain nuclease [Candidatus Omnitrophota bacterium]